MRHWRMVIGALLIIGLGWGGCDAPHTVGRSPLPTPTPRLQRLLPTPRLQRLPPRGRVWLPLVANLSTRGAVWRDWPTYKFGLAATAVFLSDANLRAVAFLPIGGGSGWNASHAAMTRAAARGVVYYPRLQMKAIFNPATAPDLDGVVDEGPDLVRCEPTRSQEAEVRRIARDFPGALYDLFNEPDNLDLTAGNGCWDPTTGGAGYHGFDGDPTLTGPRHAYRQAASVVRDWVTFVRAVDPTARFSCCGELDGQTASYVRGVADAYRELYNERLPIAAVNLHIYRVDSWDVSAYQAMLRQGIAQVDAHPDLRGLPIMVGEGILLTRALDGLSRERAAWLLYHWMDWLGSSDPAAQRVRFMAWWVDALCSALPAENPDWEYCRQQWEITSGTTAWPGTRLFDDKRLERRLWSPSGLVWRRYWCNWLDDRQQPVPAPCPLLGEEYP